MTRSRIFIAALALCVVVAVGAGFASSKTSSTEPASSSLAAGVALQNDYANVYKQVSPSVVQIQTSAGLGSGIVFDSKGDIVTNDHVVAGAKTFTVTPSNGHQLTGKLVGTFQEDDLAVIRVKGAGLRPARFADSTKLQVGDIALAIGNPLGLSSSFTEGIVSALDRTPVEENADGAAVVLPDAIQTSAAINPGNSGGALVDLQGQVIGIPTLAAEDEQLGGAAVGIGFAIPSNEVVSIAKQLVQSGKVTKSNRAYLGIYPADTSLGNGVYVDKVAAGGPAAKAGIKVGDRIAALNGTPTSTSADLVTVLAGLKPGQTVTVKIIHQNGATGTLKLALGEYPGT